MVSPLTRRLAVATIALLMPVPSHASTFVAWAVTGVPKGDLLNVRAYPSPQSRIQVGYPSGTTLSMTGRCTGGVDLQNIQGQPAWKQRGAVRYRWCEVWHDPAGQGDFKTGWVYGRYIRPR